MPNILISCVKLANYAGSEITTLELAEEFVQRGWKTYVASFFVDPIIREHLLNLGASYIDLRSEHPFKNQCDFDLAWIHHNVCAYRICLDQDIRIERAIFSSLSHFEITEQLPAKAISFSCYVAHSKENRHHIEENFSWAKERLLVIPNSAPTKWWKRTKHSSTSEKNSLKRLAIISNHAPAEILEAAKILQQAHHINVMHYGIGGEVVRITPEILWEFDAVISIGKTVQYAIASEIPIYCYDHFGGPGWITPANFSKNLDVNFSGRGQPKLDSNKIASDIIHGFVAAKRDAGQLHQTAADLFSLANNVDQILSCTASPFSLDYGSTGDCLSHLMKLSLIFSKQVDILENARYIHSESEKALRASIRARDASIDLRLQEIKALGQRLNDAETGWHTARAEANSLTIKYEQSQNSLQQAAQELSAIKATKFYRLLQPVRALWSLLLKFLRHPKLHSSPQKSEESTPPSETQLAKTAQTLKETPLITVIIPVHDRTDLLKTAIDSVLAQTYENIELIIVTDGSPSETLEVLSPYRRHEKIRIFDFNWSSGNAVRGRNKGIIESRGEFIAFLDSDDIATPNRIDLSVQAALDHGADVIYGSWEAIIDGSRSIENIKNGQIIQSPDATYESLIKASIPCQSTVMVRKSALMIAGLLKPEMKYREDHELWARLAYFGFKFKSIPDVLTKLRLHSGNNELNFQKEDDSWYRKFAECHTTAGPLPKKIAFLLPGVGISGGVAVVFRHAMMLANAGHDVLIINVGTAGDGSWFSKMLPPIYDVWDYPSYAFDGIDILFATGWQTAEWLEKVPSKRRIYFVQSDERRFFDDEGLKRHIESTYRINCEYITEAHWIARMLKQEFDHQARYVPNGIDPSVFFPGTPLYEKKGLRARVLLEGPLIIPFKGMADAYAAVADLDCEIWLVSSAGAPPGNWRVDKFFEKVSFEEMRAIYASCDIFLKMSRVEGFFGPPMEAMACGCAVVVGEVTGYEEFIVHDHNALVVKQGDVYGASKAILSLMHDDSLRRRLIDNGYKTAASWTWSQSHEAMLEIIND